MNLIEKRIEALAERRRKKEVRIMRAVLILKNGEAINPEAVSASISKDLVKWARAAEAEAKERYLLDKRKIPLSEVLAEIRAKQAQEAKDAHSIEFIEGAQSLQATLQSPGLHCKAKTRCRNRGYYREPMPSPSGKDVGAFKVIKPKRKED